MAGGHFRFRQPSEQLDAVLEFLVVGPAPGDFQDVLEIARLRQRIGQIVRQRVAILQAIEELRRQHRVQQDRLARQPLRQAGRRAHDFRDEVKELRMRIEQRKELHPRRQAFQEIVEPLEGFVRVGGVGQRLE